MYTLITMLNPWCWHDSGKQRCCSPAPHGLIGSEAKKKITQQTSHGEILCVSVVGSADYLRKCSCSQHWMELGIPPPPLLSLPAHSGLSLSLCTERARAQAVGLSWRQHNEVMSEYFSTDPFVCRTGAACLTWQTCTAATVLLSKYIFGGGDKIWDLLWCLDSSGGFCVTAQPVEAQFFSSQIH